MKKTLGLAAAAVALSTPAIAANLENPLYMPKSGEIYSKTGLGVMLKVADSSDAHVAKGHDGETEFPIWRLHEDLGIGVTDRLAIRGAFGYTHDADIDRKGMHHGRLGVIYRAIETLDNTVLDVYADAHLGGVSKMRGAWTAKGFQYDNYSNGRWGVAAGLRFGKTWSKLTTSAFVETLKTFGTDNNVIDVSGYTVPITGFGVPSEISVDLKSTTEINAGVNAFYQIDDRWSVGGGFKYVHHADNGVKSVSTDLSGVNPQAKPLLDQEIAALSNMQDGFDEYIVSVSVANQVTDALQVALYGEYTFDKSHPGSQNGTDVKAEAGVRLNVAF